MEPSPLALCCRVLDEFVARYLSSVRVSGGSDAVDMTELMDVMDKLQDRKTARAWLGPPMRSAPDRLEYQHIHNPTVTVALLYDGDDFITVVVRVPRAEEEAEAALARAGSPSAVAALSVPGVSVLLLDRVAQRKDSEPWWPWEWVTYALGETTLQARFVCGLLFELNGRPVLKDW